MSSSNSPVLVVCSLLTVAAVIVAVGCSVSNFGTNAYGLAPQRHMGSVSNRAAARLTDASSCAAVEADAAMDAGAADLCALESTAPEVYAAALRYFNQHTASGGPHALASDIEEERARLVFTDTSARGTGESVQRRFDELVERYPGSVEVPLTRPLWSSECYDEVWLDLTENGRYYVTVERATFTPVFMRMTYYRP